LTLAPALADLFDPTIIHESGLRRRITELSESIAALIGQANSLYSSKHGVDLFKPTNKTAAAQLALGKPAGNLAATNP
jgi:hypothetical protein